MSNDNKKASIDSGDIEEVIIGRVKPHIYAFSTNTVPNYLKIGDTYRPVKVRLDEWRKKYSNLTKQFDAEATVSEDVFFRDYSVHDYIENTLNKERLEPGVLTEGVYYSNEFFKDTSADDVKNAISDIKDDFDNKTQKYQYYNFNDRPTPVITSYASTGLWTPRPNQAEVIQRFSEAVKKGRTNLLLYAVMRFGKTFTSMCCAIEASAKTVLIVSAKADVKEEWRMTIQSADNFKDYVFLDSKQLNSDGEIIKKTLADGKRVAIFLTLEDLQGDTIKEKHREIFGRKVDLLLIDETHFGARAKEYGKVLRESRDKTDDVVDFDEAEAQIKVLKSKVRIHLSGTPYRILMSHEFEDDDIIGFYQATDILDSKAAWDSEHFDDIDNQVINPDTNMPYQEWDNPYFGFPQMVRFAFTPSKRIRATLAELQSRGVTSKLNKIFEPKSTSKKPDGSHKYFVFEDDIFEFLRVIDGAEDDDELFGFLDYDKLKDGYLCRHMVFVLPYRASCDAMERIITENKDAFKNLSEYDIINISGVESPNKYKNVNSVKSAIKHAESKNRKTITLTVNRMLTGSTVPEWDTMLYLKDTSSPQEYDQATFRLQNQFVEKYLSDDGDFVKYDKKPQTLLIDFSPSRVFSMQESRSLFYNAGTSQNGRDALIEHISKDLSYFPIITINKNHLHKIDALDLLSAIDNYSRERGIYDEAQEIPIDFGLLNDADIRKEIEMQGVFKGHQGFELNQGEDDDSLDISGANDNTTTTQTTSQSQASPDGTEDNNDESLESQFKTYYSRILFYAALTDSSVESLNSILKSLDSSTENLRIASNLGLNINVLSKIAKQMDVFAENRLDATIARINRLSNDDSLTPLERAQTAIKQFDRLSESEVVTSQDVCHKILSTLGEDALSKIIKSKGNILDIASKKAEFAVSLVDILNYSRINPKKYKDKIYSIPTSKIAYEFTRKIYKTLGLNVDNIAPVTSYDLLSDKDFIAGDQKVFAKLFKKGKKMEFDAIVGNPPYNISDGGAKASSKPIYNYFVESSNKLTKRFTTMIIPTRWFVGGKGLDDFRATMLNDANLVEIHDFLSPDDVFPSTNNRGGVCYFLRDKKYDNSKKLVKVTTHEGDGSIFTCSRPMIINNFDVFIRDINAKSIIDKTASGFTPLSSIISPRQPFGIEGNFAKTQNYKSSPDSIKKAVLCYSKGMKHGFIDKKFVTKHKEWIDVWKVFIPRANNIGTELNDDNMNAFIGKPGEVCTESYIAVGTELGLNETSAKFLEKYLKTRFARYMHSLLKGSHDATSKTFSLVPCQDFTSNSDIDWTKDIDNIDKQLYKKYSLTTDEIALIERRIKPYSEEN